MQAPERWPSLLNWLSVHSFVWSVWIAQAGPDQHLHPAFPYPPPDALGGFPSHLAVGSEASQLLPNFQVISEDLWPNPMQSYLRGKVAGEGTYGRSGEAPGELGAGLQGVSRLAGTVVPQADKLRLQGSPGHAAFL